VVEEEQGIYREEVTAIMVAVFDVRRDVRRILAYIEEEDDGQEAEEDL
jgi:hypothetical protein